MQAWPIPPRICECRLALPAPKRVSMRTLPLSVQPNCCNACRNAASRACKSGSFAACGKEYADAPHPLGLLRACCQRPCGRRATQERDELAPPHSITSSARSSSDVGSSIPSVLALFGLTTTLNFTARSIGRFAGRTPFRILSTKDANEKRGPQGQRHIPSPRPLPPEA